MATLSQNAQKELIRGLLDFEFFRAPQVQMRLSYYAYASVSEKHNLICELMDFFWSRLVNTDIFPVFRDFDSFLAASGKRGHFIHQFEVFLLGLQFIRCLLGKDLRRTRNLFRYDKTSSIFYAWLIVATTHDLGYPLQASPDIAAKLAELYKKTGMFHLALHYSSVPGKNMLKAERELRRMVDPEKEHAEFTRIDSVICSSIAESLNVSKRRAANVVQILAAHDNHGYVSAVILCQTLINRLASEIPSEKMEKSWIYDVLRMATGAIALHAISQIKKQEVNSYINRISFKLNPYAYLLFLVDNIQDWSRAVPNSDEWPIYNLTDFSSSDDEIRLHYALEHNRWTDSMRKRVLTSVREKKVLVQAPSGPAPPVGSKAVVTFDSNDGHSFESIYLNL